MVYEINRLNIRNRPEEMTIQTIQTIGKASIKNKWHHCQYRLQNSLQFDDCKGVQFCFLSDSTPPKLTEKCLVLSDKK